MKNIKLFSLLALALMLVGGDVSASIKAQGSGSGNSTDYSSGDQYFVNDGKTIAYAYNGAGPFRTIATNRNVLPTTTTSSANYVRHTRLAFKVASNAATWSNFRIKYVNWGSNSASEFAGPCNEKLKASIEYLGTTYAATWEGGKTSTGMPPNSTRESDDIASLTMPGGATGYIVTRTVGCPGTLGRIIGQGTQTWADEGVASGTNEAIDYTDGVYGKGATPGAVAINGSGTITGVTCSPNCGGTNYNAGPNVYAYELQADGRILFKTIGFGNPSAGAIASITITSGTPPAGISVWTNPVVVIGNQVMSAGTQVYGQSLVTALPSAPVKSLAIAGDSIAIGFGSIASFTGDTSFNYGPYEQGVANTVGILNLSTTGVTAASFNSTSVYPKWHDFLKASTATNGLIALGTNDIVGGATKAATQTSVNGIKTFMQANRIPIVDFARLFPRTTSTDSWATVANQTAATGFGPAGHAEGFDADIMSGTTTVSDRQYIDATIAARDSGVTYKWSITAPPPDGIHPSLLYLGTLGNNATYKSQYDTLH